MKTLLPILFLFVLTSCEREPQTITGTYSGQFIISLKSYSDTTTCRRIISEDMLIRWWDAPPVSVQATRNGNGYAFYNCVIRSTPSCVDSTFLIFEGTGIIKCDSLFEHGTVRYERYLNGEKITDESGTWSAKLIKL